MVIEGNAAKPLILKEITGGIDFLMYEAGFGSHMI
jgi:hypothetical protein